MSVHTWCTQCRKRGRGSGGPARALSFFLSLSLSGPTRSRSFDSQFDSHLGSVFVLSAQALARRQLVELKNGRLAMIATAGMLHHYFLTGKGPIELITGGGSA